MAEAHLDDLPTDLTGFLDWVQGVEGRYEFYEGRVVAMTGGRERNSVATSNLAVAAAARLRGGACRALVDVPIVCVGEAGMVPDMAIVCRGLDPDALTLSEPVALFEVLSPSTERADRGGKWVRYQTIRSLKHYVLVDPDRLAVECYDRGEGEWLYRRLDRPGDVLELAAVGLSLPLAEVFAGLPAAVPGGDAS